MPSVQHEFIPRNKPYIHKSIRLRNDSPHPMTQQSSRSLRIAITGSRGIPNNYGGFEQFAERISTILVRRGHRVTVYNPHFHPYSSEEFEGVRIVKCYSPEKTIGAAGNFVYDYLCMRHALREKCDILLVLGYTTSSIFNPILPRGKSIMVTNVDGLEWKRDKWNGFTKFIIRRLEALGARFGGHLVSDNREIRNYLLRTYDKDSTCIAYGADIPGPTKTALLKPYGVQPREFDMLIARLEKENNIETILDGISANPGQTPFLVIGNHGHAYGEFLKKKYANVQRIRFTGGIYDINVLNSLRGLCRFYFHGHSVGGTNPSLLEAMASGALIVSHDNPFNRDVLGENAFYFGSSDDIVRLLTDERNMETSRESMTRLQREKIVSDYSWEGITRQYESLFLDLTANQ